MTKEVWEDIAKLPFSEPTGKPVWWNDESKVVDADRQAFLDEVANYYKWLLKDDPNRWQQNAHDLLDGAGITQFFNGVRFICASRGIEFSHYDHAAARAYTGRPDKMRKLR